MFFFFHLHSGIPSDLKGFFELVKDTANFLKDGKNIVVHCLGGLGRTGINFILICICFLIFYCRISCSVCSFVYAEN